MRKITLSLLGLLLISFSYARTSAVEAMEVYNYDSKMLNEDHVWPLNTYILDQDGEVLTDFKMTPNPASSKFQLILPKGITNVKLEIFDVLGNKIISKPLSKLSSTIDISKWNDGVYLVKISSDNGNHIKRFVKQ
ncbi:putative secreted protein (Por secretion system target) [Gelidibacter sediminis]|uniref:Putative secreted protein (Por secretion system target) n=1 Tax=Gelidibacter sediminis TaxID=1608710 RepID=A0A4R7PZZ2_9FLAO|nr:T9SS type A sorting domain-containing protein [Gelidibacter sediminis]TDU39710.1 putative secreted protein (Por secretion system target) [Gelidibacter sediminis]